MTNYSPNPFYFRITWNQGYPTDYTGLTGTAAGGLDAVTPFKYNQRVYVTGTVDASSAVLSTGDSMFINGTEISFDSSDVTATIIEKINMASVVTDVIAHNYVSANYVTLTNGLGHCGSVIELEEGTGALDKLGFTALAYSRHPSEVGSTFTNLTNGDTIIINGITITMTTGGGLNQHGVVSTINQYTYRTNVIAYKAATRIQFASLAGQPWILGGTGLTKIGFSAGAYGGSPNTMQQSLGKQQATMRWQMVINQLESFSTPFMLGDQLGTGNYDGTGELDTMSFTIGYDHPDQISTRDELSPGGSTMLYGVAAIKRAVARGLAATYTANQQVFDPTIEARGNYAITPNPIRIMKMTVTGIDTLANLATIEGNITVDFIAFA